VWLLGAAACSGPQRPPDGDRTAGGEPAASTAGSPSPAQSTPAGSTPAADPRTPIERRRDAACEHLAPRITACAVEDARAKLGAGKIDQRQFDADTAAAIQRKHTDEFEKSCKAASYSSRQIRVLEVCFREETQCRPLLDCLGHLSDRVPASGRGG
jgi:hypothetical protein